MMMNTTPRLRGKLKVWAPNLFDWSRDAELLTIHSVRRIAQRTKVSPALALTIAELSGLLRDNGVGEAA
jgi:hypothetical protein